MDINSKEAELLLEAAIDEPMDMSDSDDCQSDDEEIARDIQERTQRNMDVTLERGAKGKMEETEDYHKMKNVENRRYQTELLKLAIERNIIICLPTGSGKTYIALKLTEHVLPTAIGKRQKIIFLANNVPLVNQQAKYFSQNLVCTLTTDDNVVRPITGDLNVDIWKEEQWDEVLNSCHILVASTQIILDALTKAYIKWDQMALLILDECHHAQKNHPMAELMKLYGKQLQIRGPAALPRVLGLTATIIKGQSKAELIAQDIEDIEMLLCCKAVTHQNYEEVLRQGWVILMVKAPIISTLTSKRDYLQTFFKTGQLPEGYELLYESEGFVQENCDVDVRYSTTNLVEIIPYKSDYRVEDPVCECINNFIQLLDQLPKDFGTVEEKSIIERINHPSLTSEEQIYNKNKGVPKQLKSFLTDLLKTYKELGPYCSILATILKVVNLIQWISQLHDTFEDSDTESACDDDDYDDNGRTVSEVAPTIVTLLECARSVLQTFVRNLDTLLSTEADKNCEKLNAKRKNQPQITPLAWKIKYGVSDKVRKLWEILMKKRPSADLAEDDQLCGLIFCERRITAQVMRWYLAHAAKEWNDELGFLKPNVMIGHSTIVGDTELARFTAKRQSKIVREFHEGKLNLLVATQVVEEGLNVPACNLVVRLDTINSYPSFVQSLGRARRKRAICYALIDGENENKERTKLDNYGKYNKQLSLALERKAIHVGEEDDDVVVGRYADPIPPYNPSGNPNGPMITATDAISLVHRYCNTLSCDKIAGLFPTAWKEECVLEDRRKWFKARVLLPIMSPVREAVEGDLMPDKTLAKRSAYIKCCVRLDEEGELSKNLLPMPRNIESLKCDFLDKLEEQFEEEMATNPKKIGTKKRTQWYRKCVPEEFRLEGMPTKIEADCRISVYKVKIKLTNFRGNAKYKSLYDFEQYDKFFGIVTNADLSHLPKFKLKANYGELEVSVRKRVTRETTLSSDQIQSLEHFQVYLRDSVYGIRSSVLKSDPKRTILIAPITKIPFANEYEFDWQLVQCLLNLDEDEHLLSPPSDNARNEMQFQPVNYDNAVLVPWYKSEMTEKPELMCALSVTDFTAKSDFDDLSKARTFEEYYMKKYGVSLLHPDFPLIHCKPIAKQLNFLTKKLDYHELRKESSSKAMFKMVPELLNIHLLPASLYVQGRYLPSVLHRIYRLMVANELRLKVAKYFNWNVNRNHDHDELTDSTEEDDDNDDGQGTETLSEALNELRVQMAAAREDENSKAFAKSKKKRNITLIEDLNPLTIDWNTLEDALGSPEWTRNSARDTVFALPEPPTRKSTLCGNLVDIDKVKLYHFDQHTDFNVEVGPQMETLMEALTLSNAQDNIDLEKLEVMGDSVLKLIVSLHVFSSFPQWDEGKMTQMRMKLISNKHLYLLAKKHKVGELLSGSIFIPDKSWLPTGFTIPEDLVDFVLSKGLDYGHLRSLPESVLQNSKELECHLAEVRTISGGGKGDDAVSTHTTYTHSLLGDKSVADAMEAIIGAYYINGGLDGAFRIMEYLGMRGPKEDGSVSTYSRESTMTPIKPNTLLLHKRQHHIALLHDLENIIAYKFKNPWLAVEALTHPTFMGNRDTHCYERLEFIGDAILDFLVTNYILKETKLTDPGKITDLRAALVNNVTFGSLAVKFQFHKVLKYDSESLKNCIFRFAEHQEENGHSISDPCNLLLLGDFETNGSVREIEVPKVLGDVFESIAGAVFVDSGMSIDQVWKVFYRLMKNELEEFSRNIPKSPLRALYEEFPGRVKFYKLSEEEYNANPKSKHHVQSRFRAVFLKVPGFDNLVRGEGSTIKQAKQAAAKYVLRKLKYPETVL